ncbi:hypothetical protein ACS0TY_026870 [Phlomoides rotata]
MDVENIAEVELEEDELLTVLYGIMNTFITFLNMICAFFVLSESELPTYVVYLRKCYSLVSRVPGKIKYLRKVIRISYEDCINHLRMSRGAFSRLCYLLETSSGLQSTRNCTIAEQVAMFLSILAHHTKNHIVKSNHIRSGRAVSKHFHRILNSVISLHSILLSQPRPIDENCTNERLVTVIGRVIFQSMFWQFGVQPIQEYCEMQSLGTIGFVYLKLSKTVSGDEDNDDGFDSQPNYNNVVQTSPEWTSGEMI